MSQFLLPGTRPPPRSSDELVPLRKDIKDKFHNTSETRVSFWYSYLPPPVGRLQANVGIEETHLAIEDKNKEC